MLGILVGFCSVWTNISKRVRRILTIEQVGALTAYINSYNTYSKKTNFTVFKFLKTLLTTTNLSSKL